MTGTRDLVLLTLFAVLGIISCETHDDSDTDTSNRDTGSGASVDSEGNSGRVSDFPDVCQYSEAVSVGEPDDDGMVLIPPAHPDINYFGRVDCSNPDAPSFHFPGVSIRTSFTGTQIGMVFNDHGRAERRNYYNVIIDDGAPARLEMIPGEATYELASGLTDGPHTVEVFKRNESDWGSGQGEFLGFRIESGTALSDISPRPGRIEFIGDSITCGYGNEVSTNDPGSYPYTTINSNIFNAWGSIAARTLHAEVMTVAASGRGAYRNNQGGDALLIPDAYLSMSPDVITSATWDVERFTPDVLVINLGSNDFSPTIASSDLDATRAGYESAMADFVETLRGYYPDAAFILAIGTMLSDSYPADYMALTSVTNALQSVIDARSDAEDNNVHLLVMPQQQPPYGEDWHPTVATHQSMAHALVELITSNNLM